MNISNVNYQSFTGRYLYEFSNEPRRAKFYDHTQKDEIVVIDNHVLIKSPHFPDLLLLTGHDYEDYKIMSNFVKEKNPIMDKSIYEEKLYKMFAKNADVVDLKREKFNSEA